MPYTYQQPIVFEGTLEESIQKALDEFNCCYSCIEADTQLSPSLKEYFQEKILNEYYEKLDTIKDVYKNIKSASTRFRHGIRKRARTTPTPVHLNGTPGVPFDATPSPSSPVFSATNSSGNPSAPASFLGRQPNGAKVDPMFRNSFNAHPIPLANNPMNSFGKDPNVNASVLGQKMQRLEISADSPGPSARCPRKKNKKAGKRQQHQSARSYCVEPGCSASCIRDRDLPRHIETVHKKSNPFQCVVCLKTFTRADSLQRHIRDTCTKKGFKHTKTC